MVALSAVAAVITTFIMGALSDRINNRRLFISGGYVLWGIVTAMFGFISKENVTKLFGLSDEAVILSLTVWFVILMDIVMTFMGSTSNDAAFQAWVTDITVPSQRPIVETVLSVVGTISSFAVMGVGSLAETGTITYKAFFMALGLVVTLCGIVGFVLIKDPPRTVKNVRSSSYFQDLIYGFRPSVIKENSGLYLALTSFCFAIVSYQVFYPYILIYIEEVILPDNGGIEGILTPGVIVTAVVVVVLLLICIVTLLKIANKKTELCLVISVILMTFGFVIMSLSTNIYPVLVSILPVVLGNAVVYIMFGATVKNLIPEGKAGLFQGTRMIFTVLIPMVVGPFIGDFACRIAAETTINEAGAEMVIPSKLMFLFAGAVCIFALVPLYFLVKKGINKKESEEITSEVSV